MLNCINIQYPNLISILARPPVDSFFGTSIPGDSPDAKRKLQRNTPTRPVASIQNRGYAHINIIVMIIHVLIHVYYTTLLEL